MKLGLPLRDIDVTQYFGTSFTWYDKKKKKFVDFYKNLGFKGHMGIDFWSISLPALATHDGTITKALKLKGAGNFVEITNIKDGKGFKTGYAHLKSFNVKVGDRVKLGQVIGITNNTGIYTTGSHLHYELKLIKDWAVANKDNGYGGAIDPSKYFKKNWDKPNCYHRYGRKQEWLAEFNMRFKNIWLHRKLNKQLNKIYDTNFINKLVYGGWSFEEAINPAMNYITDHIKKDDLKRGIKPFK